MRCCKAGAAHEHTVVDLNDAQRCCAAGAASPVRELGGEYYDSIKMMHKCVAGLERRHTCPICRTSLVGDPGDEPQASTQASTQPQAQAATGGQSI